MPAETALVCAACGERVDPRAHPPFRCPRSGDDRDHLLNVRLGSEVAFTPVVEEAQPFARYASMLWGFDAARSRGWSASRFANSVQRLDAALEDVAGVGLRCTGPQRSDALSDALGCSADGGVWVVDETNQPSGSHKARHLFGVALWIDVAEALGFADGGDPLAVASCGNAALAAANLALAAGRELLVFVPEQASADTLAELRRLDAEVVVCPREEDDPPGDPCVHRFHEALADGALPFSCQGTENGLVVEGARTIAWDAVVAEPRGFDRVQLQVGGGAFASGFAQGAEFAVARGAWPKLPRILAVQSAAVSPLAPAWRALAKWTEEGDLDAAVRRAAGRRAAAMRPVEHPGTSVAEGILDDETYDWLELARLGIASGGAAQVVSEDLLREAHRLGREATGIDVCATGTAGLAGLLLDHAAGKLDPHERALVVFTGGPAMSRTIRVALTETRNAYDGMPASVGQLESLSGRLDAIRDANVEHHVELAEQAANAGAQLVGFGELFTGPYFALEKRAFWRGLAEDAREGPTVRRLAEIARRLGVVVVAPLFELDARSGKRFNTAVVIEHTGEVLGSFRKVHIPVGENEQGSFHETFYYEGSNGGMANGPKNVSSNRYYPVFETSVGRVGVAICYDRHFPGSVATLAANGAQVVMQPSVTFGRTSQRMWPLEAAVDALRHRVFVCPSNRRGAELPWGIEYFGESACFGPGGRVPGIDAGPELRLADLELGQLTAGDSGWDLARDRRPDCYR